MLDIFKEPISKTQIQKIFGNQELQAQTNMFKEPLQISGVHQAAIFSIDYSQCGQYLASAGFDQQIHVWQIDSQNEDEKLNQPKQLFPSLSGHKNSILQIKWNKNYLEKEDASLLYSCGAKNNLNGKGELYQWDMHTFKRARQYIGHRAIINSIDVNGQFICSASDDSTVKVWDNRSKEAAKSFKTGCPNTSVAFSRDGEYIFAGGIDNLIKAINIKRNQVDFVLQGHNDTITGLAVSNTPNTFNLLSNSMDNSVRLWDTRPYISQNEQQTDSRNPQRQIQIFTGHAVKSFQNNLIRCSFSPNDQTIASGSADSFVYLWNRGSGQLQQRLGGHKGSVNDVAWKPESQNDNQILGGFMGRKYVITSASSDKTLILGEA